MGKARAYLEEVGEYLPNEFEVIIKVLTDSQFVVLKNATEECCGGTDPGIDATITRTLDTIEDFLDARINKWTIPGKLRWLKIGLPSIMIMGAQTCKGEQRRDLVITNMGDYRLVIE